MAQMVKTLSAVKETWVLSLGQEDPLKKGMAIHCSILAWRIPRTEEPGGLQSMGSQRVRHDWACILSEEVWPCWQGHVSKAVKWIYMVCDHLSLPLETTKLVTYPFPNRNGKSFRASHSDERAAKQTSHQPLGIEADSRAKISAS